ncbi:MAG: hypothetical protein ACLFM9_03510 [Candidatus Aenigmatarchaeota archaeon]
MSLEIVSENEYMDRDRFEVILNSAADGLKEEEHVVSQVHELSEVIPDRGEKFDLKNIVTLSGFLLKNFSDGWREKGVYDLQRQVQYKKGELEDLRKRDFKNMLKDYAGTKLVMSMKPVLDQYEGDFEPLKNYLCDLVDRSVDEVFEDAKSLYSEFFKELQERKSDFDKMYR